MENFGTRTVGDIAVESPATTRVFEEYKIDYCCHGNTLFDKACEDAGADPEMVTQKIDEALRREETVPESPADGTLSDLIHHILSKHHVYTKQEIIQLTPLMEKVATRHGEKHPELLEMQKLFRTACDDLGSHLMKEEMVLFPYVVKLETRFLKDLPGSRPHFGTVTNPVHVMNIEHDAVGDLLRQMRAVSNEYAIPEGACTSYTALYARLTDLERDLHQHIHLENNILFPRAIEMERKVFGQSSVSS